MIQSSPSVPRVLVVGLDGATYELLVPWAESGLMPNLARLMARSSLSVVNSTQPCITPVAWTTFQTGCDPAEHGILDYRYLDHRRRRLAGRLLERRDGHRQRPRGHQRAENQPSSHR